MNIFYSTWFLEGFWHPPKTPSHLLLLLAIAVLFGQQGRLFQGKTIIKTGMVFISGLITGFVINHYYEPAWSVELILLIAALVVSLLVVLRLALPQLLPLFFVLIAAVLLGLDSRPIVIPGFGNEVMYQWLAGVLLSMLLLLSVFTLLSHVSRNLVNGVVLRVAGSWIATSALFVLTLLFVKK